MRRIQSPLLSLLLHLCFVALLVLIGAHPIAPPKRLTAEKPKAIILFAPPIRAAAPAGGGNRSPLRKGHLPRSARRTFLPPPQRTVPEARLVASASIDAPDLKNLSGPPGAPNGLVSGTGLGTGGPYGIGAGCCGGVGNRNGSGVDGRSLGSTTRPVLIYRVDPEFSDEARKAKYSGTVLIALEIGPNGLPENLRVVRSLGLGLDEKALEAVAQWRFRPALRAGKPVAAPALVEVHFHLL